MVLEHARDFEVVVCFGAEAITTTWIAASVAWVDDNGVKRGGRSDGRGPEDGIDNFK